MPTKPRAAAVPDLSLDLPEIYVTEGGEVTATPPPGVTDHAAEKPREPREPKPPHPLSPMNRAKYRAERAAREWSELEQILREAAAAAPDSGPDLAMVSLIRRGIEDMVEQIADWRFAMAQQHSRRSSSRLDRDIVRAVAGAIANR